MADQYHEANRRRWDAGSASWADRADTCGIWKRCHLDPSLALDSAELRWLDNISGKRVAVLGSGDNQVVFALCGMGAKVTSIDISEPQLDVARHRAAVLGLDIKFVRADVVDLSCLSDGTFDLVYTGGHVAVWVSDLQRYYGEAARIARQSRVRSTVRGRRAGSGLGVWKASDTPERLARLDAGGNLLAIERVRMISAGWR